MPTRNVLCGIKRVCVWCDVLCRFVVVGRRILIDNDSYLLCFVIIVFVCVWYFSLVICGNSSTQSQAPEDGYINVQKRLSA